MNKTNQKIRGVIFRIALTGICAAMVESVKVVFEMIPNVEGTSLLTALFGYSFGSVGVYSSIIFCFLEVFRHGAGYPAWIILYFTYWPFLAAVFMLLRKVKVKNRIIITAIAVIMTMWFSFYSVLLDACYLYVRSDYPFWLIFGERFLSGIWWFVIQTACNAVVFPLLFRPLSRLLEQLGEKFMPTTKKNEKNT